MPAFDQLHLSPSIASALQSLGWAADDPMLREAAPTAARGHNLVAVTPPVPAYAAPALAGLLSRSGKGRRGLLLCPLAQLDEWGGLVHLLGHDAGLRVQVAHGTARATRRLLSDSVDFVVATPETALALHRRSALGIEELSGLLMAWPESWENPDEIAPLMQDLPKDMQRLVYTGAPERAAELVERYARRALTLSASSGAAEPAGPVRTVSVPWSRRMAALGDLMELLDPSSLVVWTADRAREQEISRAIAAGEPEARVVIGDAPKAHVIIAFDLPTPERLRQLLGAGEVTLLVPPGTESYVERIAAPRRVLRLPGVLDAVTTAGAARRVAVIRAMETASPERALQVLSPLFERFDPSAVAAALYELWITAGAPAPQTLPDIPATAKIYVGVGKKDGATVNDLVAVLTKEIRVEKGKIGRVELRDAFALVELPAQDAERVAGALNGVTIRRKRVTARVDRGGTKPARTSRPTKRG
jgi:ATP-dependent RNA helicase DeaD